VRALLTGFAISFHSIRQRVHIQGSLYGRNAPQAACMLMRDAFKHSTKSRPASIALIVQRRAFNKSIAGL
jgi:hypothetical protein